MKTVAYVVQYADGQFLCVNNSSPRMRREDSFRNVVLFMTTENAVDCAASCAWDFRNESAYSDYKIYSIHIGDPVQ